MSQANQMGTGSSREKLVSANLPSYELLSLESSDPDRTPTRLDFDARALDRALASSPAPEEIEAADILEAVPIAPASSPSERSLPLLPPQFASSLLPPPPRLASSFLPPPPQLASSLLPPPPRLASSLLPPNRAVLTSVDLILDEPSEPFFASSSFSSFAPVSMEEPASSLSEQTFVVHSIPISRARRRLAWALGFGLLAGVPVLGVALRSAGAKDDAASSAHSARETARVVATTRPSLLSSEDTKSAALAVDVTSLPRAPVGTVSLAAAASSHRLIVDGVVAPSGSVVVRCGKHLVRVGSKGRRQVVNVACGGETIVAQ